MSRDETFFVVRNEVEKGSKTSTDLYGPFPKETAEQVLRELWQLDTDWVKSTFKEAAFEEGSEYHIFSSELTINASIEQAKEKPPVG